MREFNPEIRENQITWQMAYILTLVDHASVKQDSSTLLHACFESRNLLEKIEFDLVQAAMSLSQRKQYLKEMSRMDGTKNVFNKLEKSFHDYQTYLKALCKAYNFPKQPSDFDIKTSRRFKTELNDFCHLYSKADEDFVWGSAYLKEGEQKCREVLKYIVDCKLMLEDGSVNILGTTVTELHEKSGGLYHKWKEKIIKTEDELIVELKKRITDTTLLKQ